MKKTTISLILISLLSIYTSPAYAESFKIDARSCILIDAKTGQVLYEQNADEKGLFPASTTKIMTAILAIEKGKMDQVMTASKAAVNDIGKDGMNIGIMAGEEIRMEYLLDALLISSANETANIIAENICPTREEFVDLMNVRAKELGAVNTHFVNPCGAHHPEHVSTARDLAIIARHAMTLPDFRKIVRKKDYTLPPTNKHSTWPVLGTTNRLMYYKSDAYTEVTGIKTGYTGEAGHNLVSSAVNKDGMELISVIMDAASTAGKYSVFVFSRNLLEYGFKNYSLQKPVIANEVVKNVRVANARDDGSLDLLTAGELNCVLPNDKSLWNIEKFEHLNTSLEAPVEQGTSVGYIEYKRNGATLGKVDIIASRSIELDPRMKVMNSARLTAGNPLMKKVFLCILAVIPFFLLLRFTLKRISRALNSRRIRN